MNNSNNNRVTITATAATLAVISERSPGYAVTVISEGKAYDLSNIAFARRNGRRNRSLVDATCNGRSAQFNADEPLEVAD